MSLVKAPRRHHQETGATPSWQRRGSCHPGGSGYRRGRGRWRLRRRCYLWHTSWESQPANTWRFTALGRRVREQWKFGRVLSGARQSGRRRCTWTAAGLELRRLLSAIGDRSSTGVSLSWRTCEILVDFGKRRNQATGIARSTLGWVVVVVAQLRSPVRSQPDPFYWRARMHVGQPPRAPGTATRYAWGSSSTRILCSIFGKTDAVPQL